MESNVLRFKSVLDDLKKFAARENEISSLNTLNQIISSSQEEEAEFLYNSDGIDVIMYFMENDSKLENICLKILANASKKHEKVRAKLLQNNILQYIAVRLKNETDLHSNNLVLYSALIVVLLQGNYEAQNQMRTSGCLSSMLQILSSILDAADGNPLPSKVTELIIYAIIASNKVPRHAKNQSLAGWITPKILEYLGKEMIFFSSSDQLQLIKCFWFFLKTVLDRNELNQQIFLNFSGLSILFRGIQCLVEEGQPEDTGDLLIKLTGVLVKLKSNREFLHQASSYCPVMILSSLLKTNNLLVIQQAIIFLDCLTREFPNTFQLMTNNSILREMEQAKMYLLENKMSVELYQNLWNRMKMYYQTPNLQREHFLSSKLRLPFGLSSDDRETALELSFLQTHFCVVHDADLVNLQGGLETFANPALKPQESKLRLSTGNLILSRKDSRVRDRKLRKIISQNFSPKKKENLSIIGITGRIVQIFQRLLTSFIGYPTDDFNNNSQQ